MSEDAITELSRRFPHLVVRKTRYRKLKIIGVGGFARIWLARDRDCRVDVALKELKDEPDIDQIRYFVREVSTMAEMNHPAVVNVLGVSADMPFTLVVPYFENGSLFHAVRDPAKKSAITSSKLTIIALGVCSALMSIHSKGVMHRDLKSPNILLDDDFEPHLCDFGIARFNKGGPMTTSMGTPATMAPEMFDVGGYDNKVDVYAFGCLLWEMLCNETPWKGLGPVKVMMSVVNGQRPLIPRGTPEALADLITKCWDQTADRRPTFADILELFLDGIVAFPGTDKDMVAAYAARLDEKMVGTEAAKSGKTKEKPEKPPTLAVRAAGRNTNTTPVQQEKRDPDGMKRSTSVERTLRRHDKVSMKYLESIDHARFREELTYAVSDAPSGQLREVYNVLCRHIHEETRASRLKFLINAMAQLTLRREPAARFVSKGSLADCPFDNERLLAPCLNVLLSCFQMAPDRIPSDCARWMRPLIKRSPRKMLIILSHCAKNFDVVKDPLPMLDLLIGGAKYFFQADAGNELISVLFYLCVSWDKFREVNNEKCAKVFICGLESDDAETVQTSYNALYSIQCDLSALNPDLIADHLNMKKTRSASLAFLAVQHSIPGNQEMITALMQIAETEEIAALILMKLARRYKYAAIIAKDMQWIGAAVPTMAHSLKLFLVVFTHERLRPAFQTCRRVPELFIALAQEGKREYLAGIAAIISGVEVTRDFLDLMVSTQALYELLNAAIEMGDDVSLAAGVKILESLGRVDFTRDYLMFADTLNTLLQRRDGALARAVHVVTILSRHPLCAKRFADLGMEDRMRKLGKKSKFERQVRRFLRNLSVTDYY